MQVRQLMGPYAGQIVEMPYAVAQNCIAAGTACKVGEEHRHPVKGLKLADPEPEPMKVLTAPEGGAGYQPTGNVTEPPDNPPNMGSSGTKPKRGRPRKK